MRHRCIKRIVSGILAFSVFISSANMMFAIDDTKDLSKEKEVKVVDIQEEETLPEDVIFTTEMGKTGYIDAGIEYGRLSDYSFYNSGYDKAQVIPEAYDSRTYGYVTSVKNQNPYGTCWAHAAVAAMESYALSHGLVSDPEDINLSEFALAYLTFEDEKLLFEKTGDYSDTDDSKYGFDAGGNDEMAYKALSNGLGLYDDDEEYYQAAAELGIVPEMEWEEENISYVLTGQKYISMYDADQVKAAVMENGAVTTSYFSNKKYINSTYGNHLYNYNYEQKNTNHAVTIVGWDDNKDKNLFTVKNGSSTYTPNNNGAWLIKNSWGTSCGEGGYIWISYEDLGILSSDAVYYEIAPKSEYENLYQHDGATVAYNYTYGYSFASVFEVEGKYEQVNSLSFCVYGTQIGYTAYLYDNSNGKLLDKGELVASTSGVTTYSGYYTVDFDADYVFMQGDKFTVIVEFEDVAAVAYAPKTVDIAYTGTAHSECNEGETYIVKYKSYGFQDVVELANNEIGVYKNVSLKAHSVAVDDAYVSTQIKDIKLIDGDKVSLEWKPVEGAVSYEVWKGTSAGGSEYKIISDITDVSYIDEAVEGSDNPADMLSFGETYYYKVRAVFADGSKNSYSLMKSIAILPDKTTTSVSISDNKLNVSWDKLDYAAGYNIYVGANNEDNLKKVSDAGSDVTSYVYDKWLDYYTDYYVAVEPYVYDADGVKLCGKYDIVTIATRIKQAEMLNVNYTVEDSMYLEWKWLDGNLADGIYITIKRNGIPVMRESVKITGTSYVLDLSRFEPGESLTIECSVCYELDTGGYGINPFYEENLYIGSVFAEEVSWYVMDNQIYVCVPDARAEHYEIYYGYDENRARFDGVIEVTGEELKAGYPLPAEAGSIAGCKIGIREAFVSSQLVPKDLISVGGIFVEPKLQKINNVGVILSGTGVMIEAIIENKMEGFDYEYQWYVSDAKNGTATPISGATGESYITYVGDTEIKYYYCEITCRYNGEKVYTTTNESGERTRIFGNNCISKATVSTVGDQAYTGNAITPSVTVKYGNETLVSGVDYTISYSNNTNVGTGKITITGKGNYAGTLSENFAIKPKTIEGVSVSSISEQTYTGSALTPTVVAKDGSYTLVNGKDYTVAYANNVNSGTATVTLTGKGNYTGTKKVTFTIKAAPQKEPSSSVVTPEKDPSSSVVAPENNPSSSVTNPNKDTSSSSSIPQKVTSSSVTVADSSNSISKITAGTTVASLVSKLNEKNYVVVYNGNAKVDDKALVGTGMTVCIMDGNKVVKKYTVIVTGDTSGDGKINITDMIAVKGSILKKTNLTGVYSKAADVNGDGKVNITDFIKIKGSLLGKDSIKGVELK